MKGITKNSDGTWLIRVTPVNPATGKRVDRIRTVVAVSEKQAGLKRLEFEQEVNKELNLKFYETTEDVKQETLEQYCEYWLNHPSNTNRAHVSKRNRNTFQNMVWPIIGDVKMKNLASQHIVYWQREIQKRKMVDGGIYAKQTILKAWRILRACVNQAGVDGRAEKLLTAGMRFSPQGKPEKKKDSLLPTEIRKFFDQVDKLSFDLRTMVYVQLTTGCRFGELTALEWSDIDFDGSALSINKSQSSGDVNVPKNGQSRSATLLPEVVGMLKEHKEKQSKEKQQKLPNVVFPSKHGTYRHPSTIWKVLRQVTEDAGIEKKISSHNLRRSLIDNMRRVEADPFVIRKLVGHATDVMREEYSSPDDAEQAVAQEKIFGTLLHRAKPESSEIVGSGDSVH